ncbi:hypothetical protein ACHAQH_002386 [Verticillium albo-atrum]
MAQYRQTVPAGGISEDDEGDWGGVWQCWKDPFSHLFAAIHFSLIVAQSYKDFSPSHDQSRQAQYLLVRGSRLTAKDIDSCPYLRAIGKQGVGIDKIDAKACAARGIPILNTPGVNARAVAELVLTLTTAVARQVGTVITKQSFGVLVPKEKFSGLLLHRKTIGILGMGNIGRCVASIFRGAFEAEVMAYDPFLPADAWADIPHTRAHSVEEVLVLSDVVRVHMPLTPETRDLIDYEH